MKALNLHGFLYKKPKALSLCFTPQSMIPHLNSSSIPMKLRSSPSSIDAFFRCKATQMKRRMKSSLFEPLPRSFSTAFDDFQVIEEEAEQKTRKSKEKKAKGPNKHSQQGYSSANPLLGSLRFQTKPKKTFTVALVGKPNVGKSTLFNKLLGSSFAIVDPLAGVTRDHKEMVSTLLGFPIKLVDTPGLLLSKEEQAVELNQAMMQQTLSVIMKADLVFFMVDGKKGITAQDRLIASWLRSSCPHLIYSSDQKALDSGKETQMEESQEQDPFEKREEFEKKTFCRLLVNKVDTGEPSIDLIGEASSLGIDDPFFASAELDYGFHEIWQEITEKAPQNAENAFLEKQKKRKERFLILKESLRREIEEENEKLGQNVEKGDAAANESMIDVDEWEREFNNMNPNPEDNSDFDSDSETNPLDTITQEVVSTKSGLSPANPHFKKPVTIALIGRPNVGKSSIVNCLLGKERMVTDPVAGTTRDSISSEYYHKGRKVYLVDTAGIERDMSGKGYLSQKVLQDTMANLRMAQIVIVAIDAMNAFRVPDFVRLLPF